MSGDQAQGQDQVQGKDQDQGQDQAQGIQAKDQDQNNAAADAHSEVVALEDVSHLTHLLEPVSYQWKLLGTALEIPNDRLEEIERTGRGPQRNMTDDDKMKEVLLRAVTKVTFGEVCEAIRLLGNKRLAEELEPKYQKLNKMGTAVTDKDVPGLLGDLNRIAYRWKMFGVHIKVEDWCLKSIQENVTCDDLLWEMLQIWIDLKTNSATIVKLISAVRGPIIRNENVAQNIAADDTVIKRYGKAVLNSWEGDTQHDITHIKEKILGGETDKDEPDGNKTDEDKPDPT